MESKSKIHTNTLISHMWGKGTHIYDGEAKNCKEFNIKIGIIYSREISHTEHNKEP